MKFRVRILARALLRALGVVGPGSVMITSGDRGQLVQVESRIRWSPEALDELPAVRLSPEPEGPV